MEVGQGRVSVAQLDGGDAQRPDVAASIVGGVQLLLTSDDLTESRDSSDANMKYLPKMHEEKTNILC